jgi:hypothetical protein
MIVRVLTACHTQYTWDTSICIFLFNRATLQVFVTYLTDVLYVHPLWFYKHQLDNRVHSTQNAFSLPFTAILINCAPSGEVHNYCIPHIIRENFENFLIHRCNYILLFQVYCVWQVVKTPTIIFNNPVFEPKRGKLTESWRNIHNEELHQTVSGWSYQGGEMHMTFSIYKDMTNVHKIFIRTHDGKRQHVWSRYR